MTEWTNPGYKARCKGKHGFRKADEAEASAKKASLRTRQLIISYKCFDCGFWHIGHADRSQTLAAQPAVQVPKILPTEEPAQALCIICGNKIPLDRIVLARHQDAYTSVCSEACAKTRKNRHNRAKKKAKKKAREDDKTLR